MIHTIVVYPDKRLKEKSKSVEVFDESLWSLLDDMYETMIEQAGIGLAAIQIVVPQQVLLINIPDDEGVQHKDDLLEIINPVILEKADNQKYSEGCLSLPEYYEDVIRAEKIVISYNDRRGATQTLEAHGLLSVAVQHEIDHLNGTLFFERLSIIKRKKFEKEYALPSKKGQKGDRHEKGKRSNPQRA
jgi:peptide deformylase